MKHHPSARRRKQDMPAPWGKVDTLYKDTWELTKKSQVTITTLIKLPTTEGPTKMTGFQIALAPTRIRHTREAQEKAKTRCNMIQTVSAKMEKQKTRAHHERRKRQQIRSIWNPDFGGKKSRTNLKREPSRAETTTAIELLKRGYKG